MLIAVFCCFTNCEEDILEQEPLKTSTPSKFRIKTLNKKDVESNTLLADKIQKLNSKSDTSAIPNKEIYNSDYGFSIDTDHVKHIENVETGYHSYTFGIIRDTITNNKVENLLLSLNADNEYNAYIVQYGFSKAEYLNSDSTLLNSRTTTYIPIDFDFSVFTDGELAKDYQMPELQCDFHWETSTVDDNEGQLVGTTSSSSNTVLVASNCQYVSSGGSGAPGNQDDDYSNTGTTDSEGTSGTGGGVGGNTDSTGTNTDPELEGNPCKDVECEEIVTAPVLCPECPEIEEDDEEDDCDTSKEDLKKIFHNASDATLSTLASVINDKGKDFNINTKEKLQHFLAQAGHEVGGFNNGIGIEESLYYTTASRLKTVYKKYFEQSIADTLGTKRDADATYLRNSSKVANYVYSSRMGNGNEASGDGYKYRGRGIFQLTGKNNYTAFKTWYNNKYDPDKDFVTNPESLKDNDTVAILSALWFYKTSVLDKITVDTTTTVLKITKRVNGGSNGIADRKQIFEKAKDSITCL